MQVTHAGYKDPNNLKFDNIIILGVPAPPKSVIVTHIGSPNTTTTLANTSMIYSAATKVNGFDVVS